MIPWLIYNPIIHKSKPLTSSTMLAQILPYNKYASPNWLILISLLFLIACQSKPEASSSETSHALFQLLPDTKTGISFKNELQETASMNSFFYEYLYNGGGVASGDFNGDELIDLYFVSSLKDNALYLNKGQMIFEDVSAISGIMGQYGFHAGVTTVDINSDGKLDIYLSKSGMFNDPNRRRNELYLNQGNDENGIPIFKESAALYGLDSPHYSTQATFFDYDRDGDLDMFLLNHNIQPDSIGAKIDILLNTPSEYTSDRLFRNDKGKFVDVSDQVGMINNGISFGLGIGISDFNNDGWADILVGQDFFSKDRLYLNQQNGTFKEIINEATGHISSFSMGNDIADLNNDGWMDFITLDMVSEFNYDIKASMSGMNPDQFNGLVDKGQHYQYMYNTLQLNQGVYSTKDIPVFSDIASMTGTSSTDWSWGPLFLDMDLDGDQDLFISNGIKRDLRNVDYNRFKDKRRQEFYETFQNTPPNLRQRVLEQFIYELLDQMPERKRPNYFYKNTGKLSFEKIIHTFEQPSCSNGATYADLDNDGDLDIITNNMDEAAFIYQNMASDHKLGNYLKVALKGTDQNLNGIGARLILTTENQQQIREYYPSRGFQSAVSREIHFGLNKDKNIESLKVIWPDGKAQTLKNVKANQTLQLAYKDAAIPEKEDTQKQIFQDITQIAQLNVPHTENDFDDYIRESLLPHKMSEEGPALAVGDVNQDGLDDVFIGGAMGYSGKLFLQQPNESFQELRQSIFVKDQSFEDVDATFFDADGDEDLDLYVVSGGNEYDENSPYLEDRLYLNDGTGNLARASLDLPKVSGSVIKPYDFDEDGDLDLFVGGRQIPGKYPFPANSYLLRNDSQTDQILFTDVSSDVAPEFKELGMVTDAQWVDINNDEQIDLVIVGEWMPITIFLNQNGQFISPLTSLFPSTSGWWYAVQAGDFDGDGDMDLVAGNLGLNSKYQASETEPFEIFMKDFDGTGTYDIVLGYHQEGELFPLRGRECSSNQMPFIKEKFPDYHSFASANLTEVYGMENVETALHYEAHTFASSYFENRGDGSFTVHPLPNDAQISTVRSIISEDINGDEHLDLILLGNLYGFEVETPRQDASYGLTLLGDGQGNFLPLMSYESGLYVEGNVAGALPIGLGKKHQGIIIVKNDDIAQLYFSP